VPFVVTWRVCAEVGAFWHRSAMHADECVRRGEVVSTHGEGGSDLRSRSHVAAGLGAMTRITRRVVTVLVVVAAVVTIVAVAVAGDDEESPAAVPTTNDGTTTPSSTMTSSTTTSTTVVTTTSTSTTRPFVPRPTGKVIPYETGLYLKGTTFTALPFGETSEVVINELSAALGNADHDTGWRKDDTCEGSSTRRITWGALEVVLTKGANGLEPDTLTFQQWHISGTPAQTTTMITPEGIGVWSTVGELKRAYPEAKVTRARSSDEAGIYLTKPEGGPFIQGFTRDTEDRSPITEMWAGLACQRILG
jgi:hypothetical protein